MCLIAMANMLSSGGRKPTVILLLLRSIVHRAEVKSVRITGSKQWYKVGAKQVVLTFDGLLVAEEKCYGHHAAEVTSTRGRCSDVVKERKAVVRWHKLESTAC